MEKRMLAALDHADWMGLIVFGCALALQVFVVGVGFWSHIDKH
jgi:hypothetical protein